jgi:hypothetical protein
MAKFVSVLRFASRLRVFAGPDGRDDAGEGEYPRGGVVTVHAALAGDPDDWSLVPVARVERLA